MITVPSIPPLPWCRQAEAPMQIPVQTSKYFAADPDHRVQKMHRYIPALPSLLILLLCSMHICHAAANRKYATTASDTAGHPSYRFALIAHGGLTVPVSSRKREWAPFPTCGLRVELPTYLRRLHIAFSGEVGEIQGVDSSGRESYLGVMTTLFVYEIPVHWRSLAVRPFCGVSNTMVAISTETPRVLNGDLFSTTESEFGICAGMDLSFRFSRVLIIIPLRANVALSAPSPFASLSFPLAIGITVR